MSGDLTPDRGNRVWSPGWSMCPNEFWDDFAYLLTAEEMVVLGFITRHWFGWTSCRSMSAVPISLDEFLNGKWVLKERGGDVDPLNVADAPGATKKRVGRGLMMSKPTLNKSLNALGQYGIIIIDEGKNQSANRYSLPDNDSEVDYDGLEARLEEKKSRNKRGKKKESVESLGEAPVENGGAESEVGSEEVSAKGSEVQEETKPKPKTKAKRKRKPKDEPSPEELAIRASMAESICWMMHKHRNLDNLSAGRRMSMNAKIKKWRTAEESQNQVGPETLPIFWDRVWGKRHFNIGKQRQFYQKVNWEQLCSGVSEARLIELGISAEEAAPEPMKQSQPAGKKEFVQKPKVNPVVAAQSAISVGQPAYSGD